ncbi:hypothetical protein SHKM778_23650 [Streptomyces sp. KM77-8]|uniref:Glycosyltransferase subfamily 4-like N-terminal domain-containing protein n=1 Tax=Streptomyces haneummycinicus TaxID=3074435 RepID=A0AAT9HF05_9ACTN
MTHGAGPRTLIITNDFPPRRGGIETFVRELADRFPPDEVVVFTSTPSPVTAEPAPDRSFSYPVIRHRVRTLLPTPGSPRTPQPWPAGTAATGCGSARRHRSA